MLSQPNSSKRKHKPQQDKNRESHTSHKYRQDKVKNKGNNLRDSKETNEKSQLRTSQQNPQTLVKLNINMNRRKMARNGGLSKGYVENF